MAHSNLSSLEAEAAEGGSEFEAAWSPELVSGQPGLQKETRLGRGESS